MSREEIKEKLPTELIIFMEFMDEILQKYEFVSILVLNGWLVNPDFLNSY